MAKVLVTGGAGFIGSYLCEALLARGDSVVALDDFSTSGPSNLAQVRGHPRFTFVEGSVLDGPLVDELSAGCDWTAHLAAVVGVREVLARPLESLRTTVLGTDLVLHAALRHLHQGFLLTSTSEVYGRNPEPLHEDATRMLGQTTVSRWSYGAAKAVDEFFAIACWRELGLPVTVVRLFNTVGPRQSPAYGAALPRFVDQALTGRDLTVYGDGQQSRTFCYITDVIAAILALLAEPAAVGLPVNVGSEEEVTVLELAQRVIRATGSRSRVSHVEFPEIHRHDFEEIPRRRPVISRAHRLTGWQPEHTLDMILERVVADTRAQLAASPQGSDAHD